MIETSLRMLVVEMITFVEQGHRCPPYSSGESIPVESCRSQPPVLSHLKSYRATDRCVICKSYPPTLHGTGQKEGKHGGRRHGAMVEGGHWGQVLIYHFSCGAIRLNALLAVV
jgi:hypothetical protein